MDMHLLVLRSRLWPGIMRNPIRIAAASRRLHVPVGSTSTTSWYMRTGKTSSPQAGSSSSPFKFVDSDAGGWPAFGHGGSGPGPRSPRPIQLPVKFNCDFPPLAVGTVTVSSSSLLQVAVVPSLRLAARPCLGGTRPRPPPTSRLGPSDVPLSGRAPGSGPAGGPAGGPQAACQWQPH